MHDLLSSPPHTLRRLPAFLTLKNPLLSPSPNCQTKQVRRSSYHDVVKIGEISKLADITGVQSYVINGAKVIFLRRRPQPRAPKGAVGASQCLVCSRHLQDISHFCSLQCRLDGEAGVRHVSLRPGSSSGSSEGESPLDLLHQQHQHYRELRHMGDVGSDSDYGSNDSTSSLRDGSRMRKKTHPARAPVY